MDRDPEKQDLEAIQHVPEDLDSPIEHPDVSTARDGEYNREGVGMGDGLKGETESDSIHSQSPSSLATINHEPAEPVAQRTWSATSSTRPRPLVPVPRSRRRGLLAKLTFVPEVEKPYHYKRSTKWFITFLVAIAAAAAPIGSAILLRTSVPFWLM
jgi:hypothetical protein